MWKKHEITFFFFTFALPNTICSGMNKIQIKDKHFELFISEEVLKKEIDRIADKLNETLKDKNPVFVVVLTGAFMFASEIIKRFQWNCEVTFMRLKSYKGTNSAGIVRELHGFVEKIESRNVVILEDIIETGKTMDYLIRKLNEQNPASIQIASLFFKPKALKKEIRPDYVACEIGNDFIVGFGLDYDGFGRNLNCIYKIKE